MKSNFTESQWAWLAEKKREGYSYGQLSKFTGLTENALYTTMTRKKLKLKRDELRPLKEYLIEFRKLGGEDWWKTHR